MKRFAVVPLLVLAAALPGLGKQTAAQTPITSSTDTSTPVTTPGNGFCIYPPYNTVSPCPVSPTPTRALITPVKTIDVASPVAGPAGTSLYNITVTSQLACFSLNEPVFVSVQADGANVAALTALQPQFPSQGQSVSVMPDPTTGTDLLSLELLRSAVGPAGVNVKAVWPDEGIERIVNVVQPAPPTATPTALPGTTPTSTAVPVDTATPSTTTTPDATETASVTTTSTTPPPFTLRACISPNPVPVNTPATLYAQTLPGAQCSANVTTPEGTPADLNGGPQTALSDGFVVFPFTAGGTPGPSQAVVQCTYDGQTLRTSVSFAIVIPNRVVETPTSNACPAPELDGTCAQGTAVSVSGNAETCAPEPPPGTVGLFVTRCVVPNPVPFNSLVTIYARTVPGASCTASVIYTNGGQPSSLNPSPRVVGLNGQVAFPFTVATTAGGGTATVTCTLGVETASSSTTFSVY